MHCNFYNPNLTIHRKIKRNMGVCTESKFSKRRSPLLSLMVPHFDVKLQLSVTRISIICNLRNCQRYRGRSKPTSRVVRERGGRGLTCETDLISSIKGLLVKCTQVCLNWKPIFIFLSHILCFSDLKRISNLKFRENIRFGPPPPYYKKVVLRYVCLYIRMQRWKQKFD